MAKKLTLLFGVIFLLVGLLGFIPNPIVGRQGVFETNAGHDVVHLIVGAVLLVAWRQGERYATLSLYTFAGLYLLIAILGFATVGAQGSGLLLGFLHVNGADNWLHLALALALGLAGVAAQGHLTIHRTSLQH